MTKSRIKWIDIAKGIGILLVVLGHTMSPVMGNETLMHRVYRALYAFHMPLFFLLSGLTASKLVHATPNSCLPLLKQRAVRLLLPYFTWAIIYIPMKLLMKEHVRFTQGNPLWTILIGNNPAGQLWFLYVLFILSVVTILFVKSRYTAVWCAFGMAVSFLAPLIPAKFALPGIGLSNSLYQIGFFFLGVYLSKDSKNIFASTKLAWSCGFIGCIFVLAALFGIEFWWSKAICAACICYVICFVSGKLKSGNLTSFAAYLGSHSMDIYILHAPILVIGRFLLKAIGKAFPWGYVFILTATSIVLSLLISKWIVRKIELLRFILLGERLAV